MVNSLSVPITSEIVRNDNSSELPISMYNPEDIRSCFNEKVTRELEVVSDISATGAIYYDTLQKYSSELDESTLSFLFDPRTFLYSDIWNKLNDSEIEDCFFNWINSHRVSKVEATDFFAKYFSEINNVVPQPRNEFSLESNGAHYKIGFSKSGITRTITTGVPTLNDHLKINLEEDILIICPKDITLNSYTVVKGKIYTNMDNYRAFMPLLHSKVTVVNMGNQRVSYLLNSSETTKILIEPKTGKKISETTKTNYIEALRDLLR